MFRDIDDINIYAELILKLAGKGDRVPPVDTINTQIDIPCRAKVFGSAAKKYQPGYAFCPANFDSTIKFFLCDQFNLSLYLGTANLMKEA